MLTFQLFKEQVRHITSPSFKEDVAFEFIKRLMPKSENINGYVINDGKKYKILNKVLKRYANRYVSYGKLKAELIDGYILCGISQNYGELYIYGMAHTIQINPSGNSFFYLQGLKSFGFWNSVECTRRGI